MEDTWIHNFEESFPIDNLPEKKRDVYECLNEVVDSTVYIGGFINLYIIIRIFTLKLIHTNYHKLIMAQAINDVALCVVWKFLRTFPSLSFLIVEFSFAAMSATSSYWTHIYLATNVTRRKQFDLCVVVFTSMCLFIDTFQFIVGYLSNYHIVDFNLGEKGVLADHFCDMMVRIMQFALSLVSLNMARRLPSHLASQRVIKGHHTLMALLFLGASLVFGFIFFEHLIDLIFEIDADIYSSPPISILNNIVHVMRRLFPFMKAVILWMTVKGLLHNETYSVAGSVRTSFKRRSYSSKVKNDDSHDLVIEL